jgi:predicted Zn-dependent protease
VSAGEHERNRALFLNVARSFRPLSGELRDSIEETRLRIVEARGGESLADLSTRTGNAWSVNHTAVVNDLFATDTLEAGRLVKVAIAEPYRVHKSKE